MTSMPHGAGTDVEGTAMGMGRVIHIHYLSPSYGCSTGFTGWQRRGAKQMGWTLGLWGMTALCHSLRGSLTPPDRVGKRNLSLLLARLDRPCGWSYRTWSTSSL